MGATDQHWEDIFSRCCFYLQQGNFASAEVTRGFLIAPLLHKRPK